MTSVEQTVLPELYNSENRRMHTGYFQRRVVWEQILAAVMLVPGLPVIAILILLVRLSSRGPGIFRQTRVGKGGRTFTMYKLRTMDVNAEGTRGAVWAQANDPRTTAIGRVLRKLHLDELPQLFNVLRGEMSLIGPRPERPEFVAVLADCIPGYVDRLAVLPGVTGLAQINLPPDSDLDSVRLKQILDLEYIETAGIWLDLRVLFCTFLRIVGVKGLLPARVLGLYRNVHLSAQRDPVEFTPRTETTPDGIARQAVEPVAIVAMDMTSHRSTSCDSNASDQEGGLEGSPSSAGPSRLPR